MSSTPGSSSARPGDPIYVPQADLGAAMSLGAALVEGDARLHVPNPLPGGVALEDFSRWLGESARIIWLGEYLEKVVGSQVDLTDVACLVGGGLACEADDTELVTLFVPTFEMDEVRKIPGVFWDRRRRVYVANRSADFGLIYRYLTPAMRAVWVADRNLDHAMGSLLRARAIIEDVDHGEQMNPMERTRNQPGEDFD